MDRRLPDSQAYAPHSPRPTAALGDTARAAPLGAGAELKFDSTVFTARPLGWIDPAAPAIARLPAFNVTGTRLHEIQAPELYTRRGMVYHSFRRYPGLAYGNIFRSNENQAQEMYLEDRWNETKADLWQTAFTFAAAGDLKEGRLIRQEVNDEDLAMRAEASGIGNVPPSGQLQFGGQNADSKVLEIIPIFPFDLPIVHVKW